MARIVLVADDSPTIQKRALGILKGEGFEVETVSNGVAAIKRLAVLRPTLVLADVSMPGRDGYEVCEFVKKSPDHSHVPVLLVASDMEPYDDARGAQVKADGIIKKPFESQDLIATVLKFVEKYEAAIAAPAVPEPPPPAPKVVPAPVREPTQEVPGISEAQYRKPTLLQPIEHDFSSASEGVALFEPAGEDTGHHAEAQVAEEPAAYSEPTLIGAPHFTEIIPTEPEFQYSDAAAAETYAPGAEAAPPVGIEQFYGEPATELITEPYVDPPAGDHATAEYAEPPAADTPAGFSAPQFEPGIAFEAAPAAEHVAAPHSTGTAEHAGLHAEEPVYAAEHYPEPIVATDPAPSFIEGLEAAAPEPVFIEEESASHVHETPHRHEEASRTMIFRAPLEIAEPVWSDDNVTVSPMPTPAADVVREPQVEPGSVPFSNEAAMEPAAEHSHFHTPEVAESPESTSTEAAAEPAFDDHPVLDHGSPEPAPVQAAAEYGAPPEAVHEYGAPVEAAYEHAAPVEAHVHEPEPEVQSEPTAATEPHAYEYAEPEAAAHEAVPEAPHSEAAYVEMAKEPASTRQSYISDPPHEPTVEIAALEDPNEVAPEAPAAVAPDVPEPAFHHEAAVEHHFAHAAEEALAYQHPPVEEAIPEDHAHSTPEYRPEVATAEPVAHTAQPLPAYDWNLTYAIVHRVVGRMAPPILSQEAIEHIARQLAEEVSAELANQPHQPSA